MTTRTFISVLLMCAIMFALAWTDVGASIASVQIYGAVIFLAVIAGPIGGSGIAPSQFLVATSIAFGLAVAVFTGRGVYHLIDGEPEAARYKLAISLVLISVVASHLIAGARLPDFWNVPGHH